MKQSLYDEIRTNAAINRGRTLDSQDDEDEDEDMAEDEDEDVTEDDDGDTYCQQRTTTLIIAEPDDEKVRKFIDILQNRDRTFGTDNMLAIEVVMHFIDIYPGQDEEIPNVSSHKREFDVVMAYLVSKARDSFQARLDFILNAASTHESATNCVDDWIRFIVESEGSLNQIIIYFIEWNCAAPERLLQPSSSHAVNLPRTSGNVAGLPIKGVQFSFNELDKFIESKTEPNIASRLIKVGETDDTEEIVDPDKQSPVVRMLVKKEHNRPLYLSVCLRKP
ncbi:hypothetical protein B0H66DRAFT_537851 [Apodospora peruviana]|uniref:Uncharacterized protein n=1 Tax=Apodospora peruviana TaxID=516989 RepID=A0AAE0LZM4_9PEZI|nr:hypothetical protein B0H66DRAFT_537851 [Apodospora peruviana]